MSVSFQPQNTKAAATKRIIRYEKKTNKTISYSNFIEI